MSDRLVQFTFSVLLAISFSTISVHSQEKIVLGKTVNGILERGDYQYPNTGYFQGYYDHFLYTGRKGEKIKVIVDSDISVAVGLGMIVNDNDKDWAKLPYVYQSKSVPEDKCNDCGTYGKIFTIPEDGSWLISVYALGEPPGYGSTGKYTIAVEVHEAPKTPQSPLREIFSGESRIGKVVKNQEPPEEWNFAGKKDQRIRITADTKSEALSVFAFYVGTGRGVLFSAIPKIDVKSDYLKGGPWIRDVVLPKDGNYTIRIDGQSESPGDYRLAVESLGFPTNAADINISVGTWVKVSDSEWGTIFVDTLNTKPSGPGLVLARTRNDFKKPTKDEVDQTVLFVEFDCSITYKSFFLFRSIAAYSKGKLINTEWVTSDWAETRNKEQVGSAVREFVCKNAPR